MLIGFVAGHRDDDKPKHSGQQDTDTHIATAQCTLRDKKNEECNGKIESKVSCAMKEKKERRKKEKGGRKEGEGRGKRRKRRRKEGRRKESSSEQLTVFIIR